MGELSVQSSVERLRREVPDLLSTHEVPGVAIGICDASGLLWSEGFGTIGRDRDDRVNPRTMFSVQSVSKLYTATAVMTAVQDGLLDLDQPITAYLPGFTVNSAWERHPERRITLRHLLSHTAGFTHEASAGSNVVGGRSWSAHCRSISDSWLRFPVGHHYEYSNLGIDLAAYALQTVAGRPFHAVARDRLFEPLGLQRTTFDQRAISGEQDRARGYDPAVPRLRVWIPMIAAGGLYTSVEDACRFVTFHLARGERLLAPDLLDEMSAVPFAEPNQDLGYGLGLAQIRWDGRLILGHGGGGFGFTCFLAWSPADRVGVVVLTNSTTSSLAVDLTRQIFRDTLGVVAPPRLASRVKRPKIDGSFVGRGGAMIDSTAVANSDPGVSYRLVDSYLIRNDGFDFYRNDVDEFPPELSPDGPWNRDYAITVAGSKINTVRLLRHGRSAAIELGGDLRLKLRRQRSDLYFCAMGEALDLSCNPINYANIPLRLAP